MFRFLVLFVAAFLLALFVSCGDDDATSPTPCASATPGGMFSYSPKVTFGDVSLSVEIANTEQLRQTGLMNRPCLAADSGMLFAYPKDAENTFWMKDTLVPLSIAWVKADGAILEIEDMQPNTEDLHSSPAPYRYAIEANQGWFTQHGIRAGDRARLPPNLSAS